jgi:hypothetical protein
VKKDREKATLDLPPYVGGSFAPAMGREELASYRKLAETAEPHVKKAMLALTECCAVHHKAPKSAKRGSPHPSGRGTVVPLEDLHKESLKEHLPEADELDMYSARFDAIDSQSQKELRNAAFHLLWYVKELSLGREPMTTDLLFMER